MATTVTDFIGRLEREHLLKAIEKLKGGATSRFADSTKYDVLFMGRRYAPKEVVGLALESLACTTKSVCTEHLRPTPAWAFFIHVVDTIDRDAKLSKQQIR